MPLQWSQQNGYAWTQQSPRPAKPQAFSQALLARFLESSYAQETSLAEFVRAHPNAMTHGVLNQLHRRHVISWDLIKRFVARCASANFDQNFTQLTRNIFQFFHVDPTQAIALAAGQPKAAAWNQVANGMCWVDSNVFVGPSAGNVGVGIDQAEELTDAERRDLLAGAAWRGAAMVCAQMDGIAGA